MDLIDAVFDPAQLELGECEDIEAASGKRWAQVLIDLQTCAVCGKPHDGKCIVCGHYHAEEFDPPAKGKRPLYDHEWKSRFDHGFQPNITAKEITAIGWVLGRRNDPNFTLEDARNSKLHAIPQSVVAGNGQSPKE